MTLLWLSPVLKMLLNLDEADIWVFWHGEVAVDEAHQDHAGVEEECPVEPKPV